MSEIIRRIGSTPQKRGSLNNGTCPDIFELDSGDISVIGTLMTDELKDKLPESVKLDGRTIVVITRETLIDARNDAEWWRGI